MPDTQLEADQQPIAFWKCLQILYLGICDNNRGKNDTMCVHKQQRVKQK